MRAIVEQIGREGTPVLVVDGLSTDARPLVRAAHAGRYDGGSGPYYPGVRAPAPRGYAAGLAKAIEGVVADMMGWHGDGLVPTASDFSLVTTRPSDLSLIQRLPHFDGTDQDVIAAIHFLCGPEKGGTSFYRHEGTGFERVTDDRYAAYDAHLRVDITREGEPPLTYRAGTDRIFTQIATFDARFDRFLAYPGTALHSGRIPPDMALSADPADGRLTVTSFFRRKRSSVSDRSQPRKG